jgi:uncharacterized protein YheU (UPF0270 family)
VSLLLLLALAVPASAQATWSAPVTLSAAVNTASVPQVAVGEGGNATFAWEIFGGTNLRIQARSRSATGTLTAVQTISDPGRDALSPQVAIDQGGNAVFVWSRFDGTTDCRGGACLRVEARARSATGVLSAVQTLSGAGQDAYFPEVAVDQNGNAIFVWQRFDGMDYRVQTRARFANGVLSATQTLSAAGQAGLSPQVAVDQSGDAVFVWARYDGTTGCGGGAGCTRIQSRARSAAGVLSAVQTLSDPGRNAFLPEVAIDQGGNAVFVWARYDGTTDCGGAIGCTRIQAGARSATGALSSVQTLSAAGQNAQNPQAGVDQSGDAVIVWQRYDGTTDCGGGGIGCIRIQATGRSATGALSRNRTLSDPGQHAGLPQIGVDQDGTAVIVWLRYDGTTGCGGGIGCLRVQAATRSAAGVLKTVQTLSAGGQNASDAEIGVNQGGNGVAVWRRFDGTVGRIQAAVGP